MLELECSRDLELCPKTDTKPREGFRWGNDATPFVFGKEVWLWCGQGWPQRATGSVSRVEGKGYCGARPGLDSGAHTWAWGQSGQADELTWAGNGGGRLRGAEGALWSLAAWRSGVMVGAYNV